MRPGGASWREEGILAPCLRVRIVRMEPCTDLTPADAQAWLEAARSRYRLSVGDDVTRASWVLYDAITVPDDRLIGYITLQRPAGWDFLWLKSVWVEPEARRLGVASRLLAEVIREQLWRERPRLLMLVPERNLGAQCWLRACGLVGGTDRKHPGAMIFRYRLPELAA